MILKNLFLVFTFMSFLNPSFGFAAENNNQKLDMGALGPSGASQQTVKKSAERVYEQVTYEGLIKLAWSYSAYSVDNYEDLNTYLILTECNLYNKFFRNEFEWEKIRNVTKDFLNDSKDKVSRYYEYTQPIYMERYDYSLQGFPIVDADKNLKGQKNLQFASFQKGWTKCGPYDLGEAKYPSTGVLTIQSPLNLSFIRAPLQLAQQYLEWRASQGIATNDNRQAYIRYRIRIDGYEGIKTFTGVEAYGFKGKLMRIDVFADPEMMLPLYNQVF